MNGLLLSRVAMVGVVAAASSAVTYTVNDSSSAPSAEYASSAWIDDPLDGTVLELDVVTIIAHAADPDGVASVALTVDGAAAGSVAASGDDLVTVELEWLPPGGGMFELQVTGVDAGGDHTSPGRATIRIEGEPAATDGSTTTSTARDGSTTTTVGEESTTTTGDGDESTTTESTTETTDGQRITTTSEPARTTTTTERTTTTEPERTTTTTERTTTTEPERTTTTTEAERTTTTTEP